MNDPGFQCPFQGLAIHMGHHEHLPVHAYRHAGDEAGGIETGREPRGLLDRATSAAAFSVLAMIGSFAIRLAGTFNGFLYRQLPILDLREPAMLSDTLQ